MLQIKKNNDTNLTAKEAVDISYIAMKVIFIFLSRLDMYKRTKSKQLRYNVK